MADSQMIPDEQGDIFPRPDPTKLTTEQLTREISRMEEIVKLQIAAVDERLTAEVKLTNSRFDGSDTAREGLSARIDLLHQQHETLVRQSTELVKHTAMREVSRLEERTDNALDNLKTWHETDLKALRDLIALSAASHAILLDEKFEGRDKALVAALQAAKEAVEKANTATEKRFDALNEVIGQLNIAIGLLLPRAEAEARISDLDRRLSEIKSTVDKGFTGVDVRETTGREVVTSAQESRADARGSIAIVMAVVSVVLTLILTVVTTIHLTSH